MLLFINGRVFSRGTTVNLLVPHHVLFLVWLLVTVRSHLIWNPARQDYAENIFNR